MFLVFVCAKVFVTLFVIWLVELVKKHCGINEEISDYLRYVKKGPWLAFIKKKSCIRFYNLLSKMIPMT